MNKVRLLQRNAQFAEETSNIKILETQKLHANPICGDNIAIKLTIENNMIIKIDHYTNSCSICNAAISSMKDIVQGKTINEINILADQIKKFLSHENIQIDERLAVFSNIHKYPERYMCAYLPYQSLLLELNNEK